MKKVLALIPALCMVLALFACARTPEPAAKTAAADGRTVVSMIAAQYGGRTADWWAGFEKKFEEANRDVDFVVDVVSWNDINTVVNTRIANGKAPDLLNIDVFADYQADGLLLPAETWVSPGTYAKLYPTLLEQSVVDGVVWAVPDLVSARALYYNVDILEAAGVAVPTTWEELTAACRALKAYDPELYPWGLDLSTDEGQAAFAYYAWSNGGGFVDDEGNWSLNCPENVEAVQYEIGLAREGLTNSSPATETRYDLQDLFCAGKLAMMIAPNQLCSLADAAGVNYEVAPIPTNTGVSASVGVMDRIMCFDNGHSDAKLAAIAKLVDAFYEDQSYAEWVRMEDFLPATTTGGEAFVAADPTMAPWLEIVGSARFYPTAKAEWADVKQGVIRAEQEALLGGDVQTQLDGLQAQIVR